MFNEFKKQIKEKIKKLKRTNKNNPPTILTIEKKQLKLFNAEDRTQIQKITDEMNNKLPLKYIGENITNKYKNGLEIVEMNLLVSNYDDFKSMEDETGNKNIYYDKYISKKTQLKIIKDDLKNIYPNVLNGVLSNKNGRIDSGFVVEYDNQKYFFLYRLIYFYESLGSNVSWKQ